MASRSRVWLQSAGNQLERAKADKYERIVDSLTEYPEIAAAMRDVHEALAAKFLWCIPAPRYDAVYASLHEIRTRLCEVLPTTQLSAWVVEDVEGDISYLDSAEARDRAREGLDYVRSGLI
jgi:predicted trehalose synthase